MNHVLRACVDYPEHGVVAGDSLIVEPFLWAEDGQLVVALADDVATVRLCEPGVRVLGRVVEVARRVS